MVSQEQAEYTRVWWNEGEVRFIQWTNKGLLFCWETAPKETPIHMPKGTVKRLIKKGVLRIQGTMPEWMYTTPRKRKAPKKNKFQLAPAEKRMYSRRDIVMRLIRKLSGSDI